MKPGKNMINLHSRYKSIGFAVNREWVSFPGKCIVYKVILRIYGKPPENSGGFFVFTLLNKKDI